MMDKSPLPPSYSYPEIAAIVTRLIPSFAERASIHDREGTIALRNLDELRDAGLLSLALPRRYGGHEIGARQSASIIGNIARGDPSTALILAMHYLQLSNIRRSICWRDIVRDELFYDVYERGALVNGLAVEPELGTLARGGLPATTVQRQDGIWRLKGCKIFSTGSYALSWAVVLARDDEGEKPSVRPVLVRLDLPGVRIEESWRHLGMRATGSHTIVFDEVEVPDRWLMDFRDPSASTKEDAVTLIEARLVIAALYDGIACEARDWLLSFLRQRIPTNLGRSLSSLPRFQLLVGEIDALLLCNRSLLEHAYTREEAGETFATDAGLVKHVVTENAIEAVAKAMAAIGNPALSQDNPLERHYRNVLCGRIHTPQGDVILTSAGQSALTYSRSKIA